MHPPTRLFRASRVRSGIARTLRLAALLLLVLAAACPAGGQEAEQTGRVEKVRVGFGGKYKLGHWTPVQVTLSGGSRGLRGKLELIAPDGDGVLAVYETGADGRLDVAAEAEVTITRYARFGRNDGQLGIRITDDSRTVLEYWCGSDELPEALSATRELFVTVGPSIGVEDTLARNLRASRHGTSAVRITDVASLPDHWSGYEGVDILVLGTSEPRMLEGLSDAQFTALEQSIRMGGRLLWCVGRRGEQLLAGESRWARLAPGTFQGLQRLRDTTPVESYAGAMQRLDAAPGYSRALGLEAAVFTDLRGSVELDATASGGVRVPLLIRYPVSFGQVMLVPLDLDQPPFREWAARPRLVAGILRDTLDNRTERSSETGLGQVTHVGYDDLVGQLRGALDQFPGVTLVAFSWIAVLVGIYILLIGPGDYFLLRKLLGRMQWSWVTFPLVAVLFTALAWALTGQFRESDLRLNQVDVLDFDTSSAFGRSTTWTHVYSPRAETFQFELPRLEGHIAGVESESSLLAWQGLPGKGLGGMDNLAAVGRFAADYRIRSAGADDDNLQGQVSGLPIPVSGTKSLVGRRRFDWPGVDAGNLTVRFESNLLGGTIRNPLPVTLTNGAVLYGDWVYELKQDLEPGAEIRLDDLPSPRVLEWRLTRRRVVEQEAVSTRWDALQISDPARILEVMMFHRAAGGQSYTELSHRYQGYLDLSEHLQTGKAILLGRGPQPAPGLLRAGRPLEEHYRQRWTFYRVMFPVEPARPRRASTG